MLSIDVAANVFVHHESLESIAMESGLEDELSDTDETQLQQKIIYKIGMTTLALIFSYCASFVFCVLSTVCCIAWCKVWYPSKPVPYKCTELCILNLWYKCSLFVQKWQIN